MVDLSTSYLGLRLSNPLVASSSPLCKKLDNLKHMEDVGLGAVVLHSLFEEQITLESLDLDEQLSQGSESFAEALSYFPEMGSYNVGPDAYLEHIRKAKESVEIPIIGSLNGYSSGGWLRYAELIQEAGADALELNIYHLSTNPEEDADDVECRYLDLVGNITTSVTIPVAVKLGRNFSALANFAHRLTEAGARGLVLFNRFYQPQIDLQTLTVEPALRLSNSHELPERLRWTAILRDQVDADIAITGGIHNRDDILKAIMAGASVAMTTSALLRHGIPYAGQMLASLSTWMQEFEYVSVAQMRGSISHRTVSDPDAFERANYMDVLRSFVHKA